MTIRTSFFVFGLGLAAVGGRAQSLVGTAGGHFASGNYQLSWSVGEPVVASLAAGGHQLTQGFHQSNLTVIGVSEAAAEQLGIRAFPNPTTDRLYVRIEGGSETDFRIELFDALGRRLQSRIVGRDSDWPLSEYPAGNYLLRLSSQAGQLVQSFKIQKI